MRTLLLAVLVLIPAAGCHLADTPSTRDDAASISGYDSRQLRAASAAAHAAGQK